MRPPAASWSSSSTAPPVQPERGDRLLELVGDVADRRHPVADEHRGAAPPPGDRAGRPAPGPPPRARSAAAGPAAPGSSRPRRRARWRPRGAGAPCRPRRGRARRGRCGSARASPRRSCRAGGVAPTRPRRRRPGGPPPRARRGRATRGSGPPGPSAAGHSVSDRAGRRRRRGVETLPVVRHPARDGVVAPEVRQRLGRHRAVVGQTERPVVRRGGGEHRQAHRRGVSFPSPQYVGVRGAVPGRPDARPAAATIRPSTPGGPMATTPPLHGMRIIECSALGPAAITTALVDLGADVIKVEPPAGDYIREMTWPIVEGTSLMHLHLNRGKRSLVLDLRTEAGVAIFKELAADADVVVEAMRPGSLARRGVGFDDLRGHEPEARLLHHLGVRHDGSLPRLPEPRDRLRHLGRHREGRHRRGGFHVHPRARVHRDQRRAAVRRSWHPRRGDPGPCDGRGLPYRRGPVRRGGGDGLVSQRDVAGLRATGIGGHRQQGGRLRAARTGDRRHGRRGPLPGLRDVRPSARPLHGLRTGLLEELLRGPRPHGPLRALAGLEVRRPRTRQPRAPGRAARHLRHEDRPGVARFRRTGQHADRAGQHAQDVAGRPAIRRSLPAPAGRGSRGGPTLHPAALRRRGTAAPGQGSDRRAAHGGGLALRARL